MQKQTQRQYTENNEHPSKETIPKLERIVRNRAHSLAGQMSAAPPRGSGERHQVSPSPFCLLAPGRAEQLPGSAAQPCRVRTAAGAEAGSARGAARALPRASTCQRLNLGRLTSRSIYSG